ncbi:MAG: D-alanyl-D-alanine carboxypeptidase [Gammaproteobacteria bacterium]|nr:D-alanyl-D-alanine carboxypeptidase [Gammaproteobacteria bacterium]
MFRYLIATVALCAGTSAFAVTVPVPSPPPVKAASYVLMSYRTGTILAQKDPAEHRAPASTTKLMTAYLVFQELAAGRLDLDTTFTVSKKAWQQPGSRMFIEPGKEISVGNLLQGMLVPSGNDAAMALAEGVAGTEAGFVSMMNAVAKQLGMSNTHYVDPAGLSPKNHVSALDLAVLARALIHEFPQYYHYFAQKEFTWNDIHQYNWNKLLWLDPDADGLKTGFTPKAGYCLVASAKRGDERMIAVVMGVPAIADASESTRANLANYRHLAKVSESLLEYGFRFFRTEKLYDAGKQLAKLRVWKGGEKYVGAGLAEPLYVTVARGHFDDLDIKTHTKTPVPSPVTQGEALGTVTVSWQDKVLATAPLVALKSVPEGGVWATIRDTVLGWF